MTRAFAGLVGLLFVFLVACKDSAPPEPTPTIEPTVEPTPVVSAEPTPETFLVGRPQNRSGIGDVERVFARYETSRADLITLIRAQPWFQDGLTREESLFAERTLTFTASYDGPRYAQVSEETIKRKLFLYEKVTVQKGQIELMLIYEPNQDAQREMEMLRLLIPTVESIVGVEYPEKVMTVINGPFEINDYNDGQFIRIARCCVVSAFVLAHELSHTYWSMAPSWFNEGMADIYSTFAQEKLNEDGPSSWRRTGSTIDDFYRQRRATVQSGRFPNLPLPRRFASDGLYEAAGVFLLDIRKEIGDAAFKEAAREIYLASDFGRINLREKRIEDIFLKYSGGSEATVMALFNRVIWGDNGQEYQRLKELEGS